MKIQYTQVPGKNVGLRFHDISRELRTAVVGFVNHNVQWLNARYAQETRAASPFLQSDAFASNPRLMKGYLFVEFSSDAEKHRRFCEVLLEHLRVITKDAGLTFEGFAKAA